MITPDYKQFSHLAREATLVPVVKSVTADLLTPVSAFLAIAANQTHAFLLESVERGEQIGRYTFLGARPYMQVQARGEDVLLRGKRREQRIGNVFQIVKEQLREHRPAVVPGLPPFTAGAVGYFAYDIVRQLENIGVHAKDDLALPNCALMFFDRLLAFDHLRHQIHIIATADVASESPRQAYDRAVSDIGGLEGKLAAGIGPRHWHKHGPRLKSQPKACPYTNPHRLEKAMQEDEKERAEHVMLVDLGRNDIGPVSEFSSVKVRDLMFVERYSHVMHIVSALEGKLRSDMDAIDAFAACFPAGTLSGAPKVRAMQIIEELEPTRRAIYGGSVPYADFAGRFDSCIAIRTMLIQSQKA